MSIHKSLFIFALFTLTTGVNSQNGIYWSSPIEVAPSSFDDKSPRVAILSDGSPVAIWGKGSKIYFSKMEGDEFISPVEINTNGISPDIYSFGGIDLATSGNKIFIVYEDFNTGVHLVRSEDGGAKFELPVSVFAPPAGLWATLPSVGTDDQGNPLVSVLRELSNETQAQYVLMRSDDGGLTFTTPTVANEPANGEYTCECCPSDIYSKGNDVFLAFRNNDNNLRDMWVSRSSDGGLNFTNATDVDDTDWVIQGCPISGPKIAPLAADSLITVWKSGASGSNRVSFSTLHKGTMVKGWEFEFPQSNVNSGLDAPDIAGSNDTIGIVWQETGFGTNSTDLMFAFSKTGAGGLVNNFTNITEAPGVQRSPTLAYANGFFHLIYADAFGALMYQKGTISETNPTENIFSKKISFKIISQPIKGDKIIIQNNGDLINDPTFILSNLAGQKIKEINYVSIFPDQKINFNTGRITSGIYFLQINSGNLFWSEKIIVQ